LLSSTMRGMAFPIERAPLQPMWTGDLSPVSQIVIAGLTMRSDVLTTHDEEVLGEQPMTIQEAMDKAVAGGYHIDSSDGVDIGFIGANDEYSAWTRTDTESSFMVPMEETLLDPRFWQALGRILGWSEVCDLVIICVHGAEECQSCRGYYWMFQWHRFIQALAHGNTPEAFFERLTSSLTRRKQRA